MKKRQRSAAAQQREDMGEILRALQARHASGELHGLAIVAVTSEGDIVPRVCGQVSTAELMLGLELVKADLLREIMLEPRPLPMVQ
jgi:hypothetical protein